MTFSKHLDLAAVSDIKTIISVLQLILKMPAVKADSGKAEKSDLEMSGFCFGILFLVSSTPHFLLVSVKPMNVQ